MASQEREPGHGPSGAGAKPLQLAYSELQAEMLDEQGRRRKAAKILAVLRHFLGRENFSGLKVLDIGCSAGFISDEFRLAGADVVGLDIDEPGLEKAKQRFGDHVEFIAAPGDTIPLPPQSVDVVVFNHIYEHVPDPDAVMAEIRRVLRDDGVVYLGLGNRLGIMEPHYKLPFLSWLPKRYADRYLRVTGRAGSTTRRSAPARACVGCAAACMCGITRTRCCPTRSGSLPTIWSPAACAGRRRPSGARFHRSSRRSSGWAPRAVASRPARGLR